MTDTSAVATEVTPEDHKRLRWALVLISLAQLMVVLDSTIANIALPYIGADLDISQTNLPAGTRIALGDPENGGAVIEVSDKPHTGCAKFQRHFGAEATGFLNSDVGRELRLRGLNARVVQGGTVRPGDPARKL